MVTTSTQTKLIAVIKNLLLLALVLNVAQSRQIQIPAVTYHDRIEVRMERKVELRQPEFQFQKMYKIEVFQTDEHEMKNFPPCQQKRPEVEFTIDAEIYFDNIPQSPLVIYKFDDVISSQFVIDIFYDDGSNLLYMIFENGKASISKISGSDMVKDYKFQYARVLDIEGIKNESQKFFGKIKIGYFSKVNGKIIFTNDRYAILFNETSAKVLSGYERSTFFESVTVLQDRFLAISDMKGGIFFYDTIGEGVNKIGQIPPENFTFQTRSQDQTPELALLDVVYFKQKNVLLILDENHGVISFDLTVNKEQSQIQVGDMTQVITKEGCELMYLYQDRLYVACDLVYEYYLAKFPVTEQIALEHPNIKIRQIFEQGNLVAFAGRNVFKLMYLNRYVNYFQDKRLDKLIFHKGMFISANQNGIQLGNYSILKPYIQCRSYNNADLGEHSLVFKTYAECNDQYFTQNNVKDVGQISEDDICVYTVYRDIYFWEKGEIKTFPIVLITLFLLLVVVVVFIVWSCKNIRMRNIQNQLEELYSSSQAGQSGKYHEFGEQMENKGYSQDKLQNQKKKDDEMKVDGIEINKGTQNYDIQ